ncbi:hypothetical protein BVRB_6g142110 [Beta vulgaris subsp. vulgaris]|nr:hypothetical protein BVRB_6g142110 [Beta vulgaris subsp. vulgaris]
MADEDFQGYSAPTNAGQKFDTKKPRVLLTEDHTAKF